MIWKTELRAGRAMRDMVAFRASARSTIRPPWALPAPRLLLLAVLCLFPPDGSGAATWEPIGPYLAPTTAIVADPFAPGMLYAGTMSSGGGGPGVFRSSDGGLAWRPATVGLPAQVGVTNLVADPYVPGLIFAGMNVGWGVYRSRDWGETWTKVSRGMSPFIWDVYTLFAVPWVPGRFFATTAFEGPYVTDDWAETWKLAPPKSGGGDHAWHPLRPGVLYTAGLGIWKSEDNGESWRQTDTTAAGPCDGFSSIAVDPRDPHVLYATAQAYSLCPGGHVIYRSTDGGERWRPFARFPGIRDIHSVEVDRLTPSTLYAAASRGGRIRGMLRSSDGGVTWHLFNRGFPAMQRDSGGLLQEVHVRQMAMTTSPPEAVYMASNFGLYRHVEGERGWTGLSQGINATSVEELLMEPGDPPVFIAATEDTTAPDDQHLSITRDLGNTWSEITPKGVEDVARLDILTQIPGRPGGFYYAWRPTRGYGPTIGLYRTEDYGRTWTSLINDRWPEPRHEYEQTAIAVDPINPSTVYMGVQGVLDDYLVEYEGLYRSTDAGVTWSKLWKPPGREVPWSIAIESSGRAMYVGTHRRIYRSTDGGLTWKEAVHGLGRYGYRAIAIHPAHPNVIYAATNAAGVLKSTDAGRTWKKMPWDGIGSTFIVSLALDPRDPDVVYAGAKRAGLRLWDGKSGHWKWVDPNQREIRSTNVSSILIDPRAPDTIAIATGVAGVYVNFSGRVGPEPDASASPDTSRNPLPLHGGAVTSHLMPPMSDDPGDSPTAADLAPGAAEAALEFLRSRSTQAEAHGYQIRRPRRDTRHRSHGR